MSAPPLTTNGSSTPIASSSTAPLMQQNGTNHSTNSSTLPPPPPATSNSASKKRIAVQDRDLSILSLPSQDKPYYYDSPPTSPPSLSYPPLHPAYPLSLTREPPSPSSSSKPISTSNRGHKLSPLAPFTHPHKLGHHSQPDLGFPSSSTPSLIPPKRRKLNDLSSSSTRSDGFLIAPNLALIPRPINPQTNEDPYPSFLPLPPQSPLDLILLPNIQHTFSSKNHTFQLLSESTTGLIEQEGVLLSALGGVCRGLRGEGFEWRWEGDAQKERERRERREGREAEEEGKRVEREEVRRQERERKEEERVKEMERLQEEEEQRRLREVEEEEEREKEKERKRVEVEEEEERLRIIREEALQEEAKRQQLEQEEKEEARAKELELEKEKEREMKVVKPEESDQQTPSVIAETSTGADVEMSDVPQSQPPAVLPPIQTTTNTIGQLSTQPPTAQAALNEDLPTLPPQAETSSIDPSLSSSETPLPVQQTSSSDPKPLEIPPTSEQPSAPEPTPSAPETGSNPSLPLPTDQVDAALTETAQQPRVVAEEQPTNEGAMMEVDSTPIAAEQPETPSIDQDPVVVAEAEEEEPVAEEPEPEAEVEEPRRRSGRNTARAAGGSRLDALNGVGGGGTISRGISYSPDPYSQGGVMTPQLHQQLDGGQDSEIETTSQSLAQPTPAIQDPEEEEEELPLVPIEDLPEYASRLVDPESYVRSLFVSEKEVELEKCVSGPNGISGTGVMESLSSNEQEALVHDCLTDLHRFLSDTIEYRSRLSEIRDGVLEVERRRKGMWKVVRTVALDWLEEEAAGGNTAAAAAAGQGNAGGVNGAGGGVQGVYEEY